MCRRVVKLGATVRIPGVFLQVSILLSGGVQESLDNVSGLLIGLNKGRMGWGIANLVFRM